MSQNTLNSRRQNNKRGTDDDPTMRLNISMPKSAHDTLVALASAKRVSLSALLCQSALSKETPMIQTFSLDEINFFKTMIELLGPLTLNELIDLLQKNQQKEIHGI